jgi:DNA-directed RNA polymerase specialized sigma24 family protein
MNAVAIPPFERFYEEYREEIYAYLRKLAGRDAADDAFQETFLRALRGYPSLQHGRHLRAWAYRIAPRDYADIATALGSSEDAARQAASSGVRRLRRRMT